MNNSQGERAIGPRTIETYSNKLQGRVRTALDQSQLSLVGNEISSGMLKSRHVLDTFPPYPHGLEKPEHVGAFNAMMPDVVGRMVLSVEKGVGEDAYLEGIGADDINNLGRTAVALAEHAINPDSSNEKKPVIRIVLGASEEIPFRALSALTSPLVYAENLQKGNVEVPQIQIIFAHNISSALNKMDQDKVRDASLRFAQLGRAYADEFFPLVSQNMVFLEDTSIDKGSVLRTNLLEVGRELRERVPEHIRDELLGKGENGGNPVNLYYGAAHLLLHDADLPGSLEAIFPDQSEVKQPSVIISMGGYQEQFFYKLRHLVKPYVDEQFRDVPTLQFFTKHRVPPYYMARNGDISLSQVLADPSARFDRENIGAAAAYDLDYLEKVSQGRGVDLNDFIVEFNERNTA